MGELGIVRRYHYWSDRRIREIADDNGIDLARRSRWNLRLSPIAHFGQVEIGQDGRELFRKEIADRLEAAIGHRAVGDFITPPPVQFAKGIGHIEFSRFIGYSYAVNEGAVMHVTAMSSDGCHVEACLFGSMDNFSGQLRQAGYAEKGWTSSNWNAIQELLDSRGTENTSGWLGDEALAVEARKVALYQGKTGLHGEHRKPRTRGFTIGSADEAEWMAEIYLDIQIDKRRWYLADKVDRILVGAPLWIRTPLRKPVVLYHGECSDYA